VSPGRRRAGERRTHDANAQVRGAAARGGGREGGGRPGAAASGGTESTAPVEVVAQAGNRPTSGAVRQFTDIQNRRLFGNWCPGKVALFGHVVLLAERFFCAKLTAKMRPGLVTVALSVLFGNYYSIIN
jgi:hypothetical protein